MNEQQKHEMVLSLTHPSGAEEWVCPTCGRRFLISWEPNFKKIMLEAGDDFSIHSGGKGGLRIGRTQVMPSRDGNREEKPTTPMEEERLAPWEAWLKESDFEDLWNDEEK
jgi:hypothetical protein